MDTLRKFSMARHRFFLVNLRILLLRRLMSAGVQLWYLKFSKHVRKAASSGVCDFCLMFCLSSTTVVNWCHKALPKASCWDLADAVVWAPGFTASLYSGTPCTGGSWDRKWRRGWGECIYRSSTSFTQFLPVITEIWSKPRRGSTVSLMAGWVPTSAESIYP